MSDAKKAVIALVVGFVAWRAYSAWQSMQQGQDGGLQSDGWLNADDVLNSAAETIDSWTGGMLKISAMSKVDRSLLSNANVQAMLQVIRTGEGTLGPDGYTTIYGGGQFSSLADHPRKAVSKWGRTSTAAGAYQTLSKL